mmetsp:Transcript_41555/g.50556  ORF Transcript_41555/g.50556 Transcript_41555/m.50556 type:complete len:620 (-) Transcript_41555:192-2051(-)
MNSILDQIKSKERSKMKRVSTKVTTHSGKEYVVTRSEDGTETRGQVKNVGNKTLEYLYMTTKPSSNRKISPIVIHEAISWIQDQGINFLAIDFDQTLINEHTFGHWKGTAGELVKKVRPMFAQLIPAVLSTNKIHVAICTFSPQTELIRGVLDKLLDTEDSKRVLVRGEDGSWLSSGDESQDGKQPHIASAIREFKKNGIDNITKRSTLLIDDDERNIQYGLEDGIRTIWLNPNKPDDVLQTMRYTPVKKKLEVKPFEPPRFNIYNPEQRQEALDYLNANGYAVIANAASGEECAEAHNLFWDWSEAQNDQRTDDTTTTTTTGDGIIKRGDPSTWDNGWRGDAATGIFGSSKSSFNHSDFCWKARTLPPVKETFSAIWGVSTDDLIVSYDGGNAFRPWKMNPRWLTRDDWWHLDQNSRVRDVDPSERVCVQGLVSFSDATEDTGGLCVIPRSHLEFGEVCERAPGSRILQDFIYIPDGDPVLSKDTAILVCAKAGDLLLWDSRTVHCNTPALTAANRMVLPAEEKLQETEDDNDIIRLAAYVCMVPRSQATNEVLTQRLQAYLSRTGTTHWPNKPIPALDMVMDEEKEITNEKLSNISSEIMDLIGYKEEENTIKCSVM